MKLTAKQLIICLCLSSLSATAFADNTLPTARTFNSPIPYTGVSLSGGEFYSSNSMAPDGKFMPILDDAALFLYKGMNTYRIPISWEYLADINGNINAKQSYLTALDNLINQLTAQNATVIIDIHNYMRFNPDDVRKDYENSDPNGSDVIGVGKDAPSTTAFATLWANIVNKYHSPNIIYALMNEPHDISSDIIAKNESAAIAAIRQTENSLNIKKPHLILIDGNNWTGLHSWFQSENGQPANNIVFPAQITDPANNIAIEVHQYFDPDSSGRYVAKDCLSLNDFRQGYTYQGNKMPGFDQGDNPYWPKFQTWATQNKAKIFLGEFGAPDTPNCKADISYMLGELNKFADVDAKQDYGVIGWTVWSAGHVWGNYPLSVAPGSPTNSLMWGNSLYENFLSPNGTMPPLNPDAKAIQITNHSSVTMNFEGGYWPFQLQGTASLAPGGTGYLYTRNGTNTPSKQEEISYYIGTDNGNPMGFGVDNNGWGYSYPSTPIDGVLIKVDSSCSIYPSNGDAKRCYTVENSQ